MLCLLLLASCLSSSVQAVRNIKSTIAATLPDDTPSKQRQDLNGVQTWFDKKFQNVSGDVKNKWDDWRAGKGQSSNASSPGAPPMSLTMERSMELYQFASTATLECLLVRESGVRLQSKQADLVKDIYKHDFFLKVLTPQERHELNGVQAWLEEKFPGFSGKVMVTDRWQTETLHWMKSVALQGFPGLGSTSRADFKGSEEEWLAHMKVDEPFNYETRKNECLMQAQSHFEDMKTKLNLELKGPCTGTASRLKNTCSVSADDHCPEGSACGVVSQSDPKLIAITAPISIVVTYGFVALVCFLVGHPAAALIIPGQTEMAIVLGVSLASTGHNCACMPQACEWSDQEQSCSPKKHGELSLPGAPFVGFKCVVGKTKGSIFSRNWNRPSCKLTACEGGDYEDSFPLTPSYRGPVLQGRLGKVNRETFNCWGFRSKGQEPPEMNFEISASQRFEVYRGLELI